MMTLFAGALMKHLVQATAALALAMASYAHASPNEAGAAPADEQAGFLADARAFDDARAKGDCVAGLPAAKGLAARQRFGELPNDLRLEVWVFAAECAVAQNDDAEAFADASQAAKLPGADERVWTVRVWASTFIDRPDEASDAIEAAAATRPAALSAIPVSVFFRFEHAQIVAGRRDVARRIFAALEKADYKSPSPAEAADGLWFADATLAADAGETAHAARLMRRVNDTYFLIRAKLDERFATAVAADPARFDLKAAAERDLDRDRAIMAAHPELLQAINETLADLRALGRLDEALALAQSTLDRAANSAKGEPAFSDQDDKLNWTHDAKAYVLLELGRYDEAVDVERGASHMAEDGNPTNVSQTINLAGFLNAAGRPEEVLKVLQPLDQSQKSSPYGFAWVHTESACAYERLGRGEALKGELAYLAAHQADNPDARLKALLCANDLDGAAALLIGQLKDPDDRGTALVNLSQFEAPAHPTPFDATLAARLALVRVRPDVEAAIGKVGHVESIPLNVDVFSDMF